MVGRIFSLLFLLGFFSLSGRAYGDLPDAPNPASNSGPQDVAVVILDYPGTPDEALKPDASFLDEVFRGTLGDVSISDFFVKASEGRDAFRNFQIFGPYHLGQQIYCGQEQKIWQLGVQAASSDVNFQKFSRIVFVMPRPLVSADCDMWGAIAQARAELHCIDTDTPEGNRCLNFAWIGWQPQMQGLTAGDLATLDDMKQEGYSQVQVDRQRQEDLVLSKYYLTKMMAHEMLHGWDLMHNNTYLPSFTGSVADVNQSLNRDEYGDFYPIMSSAGEGNAVGWMTGAQLVRLGWLNSDEWADVEQDGTFRLAPLAYGKSGLKVLKIPRKKAGAQDSGDDLWIEYRAVESAYDHIPWQPLSAYDELHFGVVVHETSKALSDGETVLIRFNPSGAPDLLRSDYRLPAAWQDPYTGIKLELVGKTPDSATVRVTFQQ